MHRGRGLSDGKRARTRAEEWVLCEVSGKRGYATRAAAKVARRRHPDGPRLRIYLCDCGHLHLGHLPLRIINGSVTRADVYGGDAA
jgi:hypothetical protein